jgi:lipoate-protein ligase B
MAGATGCTPDALAAGRSPLAPALWTVRLGTRAYAEVLELQRAVARARITGAVPEDVLLLVEHPPVVTLGRATKAQHLTTPAAQLAAAAFAQVFSLAPQDVPLESLALEAVPTAA